VAEYRRQFDAFAAARNKAPFFRSFHLQPEKIVDSRDEPGYDVEQT
jgi:hypothetical protein